jgi:hypothetical protein
VVSIEWLDDVRPADWVKDRLAPFCTNVGSVIPSGYAAYARLFHPVEPATAGQARRRWSDVAAENGRIVHPEMQFHLISLPPNSTTPDRYDPADGPEVGSLPPEECEVLVELLRPRTLTPETCWFCHWEGYGIDDPGVTSRVSLPHRDYLLRRGPIEAVTALMNPAGGVFELSPNLWWPDDRSWFVTTEIDYAWTYIGGSDDLIATVLADARLEALPAGLDHSPFYDGDRLNAGT